MAPMGTTIMMVVLDPRNDGDDPATLAYALNTARVQRLILCAHKPIGPLHSPVQVARPQSVGANQYSTLSPAASMGTRCWRFLETSRDPLYTGDSSSHGHAHHNHNGHGKEKDEKGTERMPTSGVHGGYEVAKKWPWVEQICSDSGQVRFDCQIRPHLARCLEDLGQNRATLRELRDT